jgi:phosphoglycolate phosphatase-like HAD superfamily hydrolase
MGNPTVQPGALALDFDGVLCNGLKEYFQTSVKAYRCLWPDADADADAARISDWEPIFGRLRSVIETGWEMPLMLRAIQMGYKETDTQLNWPQVREQILAQLQLKPKQISLQVDTLRDQWLTDDLPSWLALQEFYPGVLEQLQRWMSLDLPLFIITTKESRFVQTLLQQHGIKFAAADIFGKDRQQPKYLTLQQLQAQGLSNIWFVEDRFATLTSIRQHTDLQPTTLFLGDWGYNTEGDRKAAADCDSIYLISLAQFTGPFGQWLD